MEVDKLKTSIVSFQNILKSPLTIKSKNRKKNLAKDLLNSHKEGLG